MADSFDAYHEWLGIAPRDQPPNHYRLLGIELYEAKANVIDSAADRQMAHLRTFQTGARSKLCQELLNRVSTARVLLLNVQKKAAYDVQLEKQLAGSRSEPRIARAIPLNQPASTAVSVPLPPSAAPVPRVSLPAAAPFDPAAGAPQISSAPSHRRGHRKQNTLWLALGIGGALLGIVAVIAAIAMMGGDDQTANLGDSVRPPQDIPADESGNSPAPENTTPAADPPEKPPKEKQPDEKNPDEVDPADKEPMVDPDDPFKVVDNKDPADGDPPKVDPLPPVIKRPAKPPIPTAAAQEAAEAKVRDIFDLDAAIGLAARAKLAREILTTAKDTADEPASQYVMLRMVRDMSAFHGDYAAAERAIGEMHQRFEVDVIAMRSEALVQALAAKKVPTGHRKRVVREALRVVRECHEADRYEEAKKNIAAALKSATSLRSRDLLVNIRRLRDDGEVLAKQYEAVRGAFETLKTKPDDPAANTSAGKYLCYVKADWKRGLAMLIKGNDAVLKDLAASEQRGVSKRDEQLVLADAWWDIAEQQPSHRSSALRKHAAGWYRKVLPKLTGLKKARVSKRLDAVLEAERKSVSLSSIDRIVLWNQHNSDSHNTGTLECNVILFRDGKSVWAVKRVRVPWERNLAKSIALKVPRVKADRCRVEVTRIYRDAGGFAEVQIFSGKENIALGAPVTASAPYGIDDPRTCDKITDGILSSAKHRVGYWLTKLGDPTGWAEIDLSK